MYKTTLKLLSVVALALVIAVLAQHINSNQILMQTEIQNPQINTVYPEWIVVKNAIVTAYCPCSKCCEKYADGITASGHKIKYNDKLVATNSSYEFGTQIYIPGYSSKAVEVQDRGGAFNGYKNRFDVLFYEKSQDPKLTDLEWSHQKALQWGRVTCDVFVKNK